MLGGIDRLRLLGLHLTLSTVERESCGVKKVMLGMSYGITLDYLITSLLSEINL